MKLKTIKWKGHTIKFDKIKDTSDGYMIFAKVGKHTLAGCSTKAIAFKAAKLRLKGK